MFSIPQGPRRLLIALAAMTWGCWPVILHDVKAAPGMQSLVFMGGAVVVCAMLGWLIGPSLLVGPFEGLTGTEVEDLSDLRGMGTIGGLVIGMFIGATGGWVIWSDK